MKKIQIIEGMIQIMGKIGRFLSKCMTHKDKYLDMKVTEKRQGVCSDKIDATSIQGLDTQEEALQEERLVEIEVQEMPVQEMDGQPVGKLVGIVGQVGDQVGDQKEVDGVVHHKKDNKGMIIPLHRYQELGKIHQRRKRALHQREPTGPNGRIDIKGTGT